jgi:glycosyltransferase involved in cell wall biosynthesis
MRILLFTEHLTAGGKERQVVELIKGLIKHAGFELALVITKNEIHYTEILDLGVPIHVIKRKFLKKDPRLFFLFLNIVRKFRPDVIHVFGHMPAVYSIPAKLLFRVPLLNNEIQDTSPIKNLLAKNLVFKYSDLIVGNSQAGLKAYSVEKLNSEVIYNGFTFDRLKNLAPSNQIREQFKIQTPLVVGMVATFNHFKDYDTYLKAAMHILSFRKDVTFLCIGNGDSSNYLHMTRAFPQILYLGKQAQVESIMNICDVGVLTTFGEGISNALMEFMALGKPVIATDKGGTIELVDDQISGFLVMVSDVEQVINRLELLLDDAAARKNLGAHGIKVIESRFGYEAMVQKFISAYQRIARPD